MDFTGRTTAAVFTAGRGNMLSARKSIRRENPLKWLVEPLTEMRGYFDRPMFGCLACYIHGRLALVLAAKEEPWNGLLVPTEKELHGSIMKDFNGIVQHPVLKKWLYLSQSFEDFETTGAEIVEAVRLNDVRFGVEPKVKNSKKNSR